MEDKKVYSVKEMAGILGIGFNKAYELVNSNQIPHLKLGNRYIIPVQALDEWLSKELR